MAYIKNITPCNTPAQLLSELRAFCLTHTTFTDAGSIGAGDLLCLKSPENWYYNFAFSTIDIKTTCRNAKPSGNIMQGMSSFNGNVNNDYNLAETNGITYPIVSRHLFTNGKLVVMVLEVQTGVYRHHAFGKFDMFGNGDGGEFVGGTVASKVNNTVRLLPKQTSVGYYKHIQTGYLVHPFLFGLIAGYDSSSTSLIDNKRTWIRYGAKFIPINGTSYNTSSTNIQYCVGYNTPFYGGDANTYNGRSMLYPILWSIMRGGNSSYAMQTIQQQPAFYTDLVALVDTTRVMPEDVLNNDWVAFPLVTKSTNMVNETNTPYHGVAYKK